MTSSSSLFPVTKLANFLSFRRSRANAVTASALVLVAAALSGISAKGQMTTTFTAAGNQTWTCPTGVTTVQVQAWGGGGGSGGAGANYAATGGGAGGSYVSVTSVTVTPGTVYNLIVGAGGTGGPGGAAGTGGNGGTGGTSCFGNTTAGNSAGASAIAVGGGGGLLNNSAGTSKSNITGSGGGSASTAGNTPGAAADYPGTAGAAAGSGSNETSGAGGTGAGPSGSSGGGAGGAAVTSANNGKAGTAPGGGGGGALQVTATTNGTGGAGGAGEIALTYTPVTPFITATGTPYEVFTAQGTASAPTSFSVSGANLTGNITATAPTGFEVSLSAGAGYESSVTLTQSGGTVSATPVYVRLAASAPARLYSPSTAPVSLALNSSGATQVNVTIPPSPVIAPFTAGNVVVEQADNGSIQNTTATMLELSTTGTVTQANPVQTIPLPGVNLTTSPTQALRINGSGGTTGYLATSYDTTLLAIVDADALTSGDIGQTTAADIDNREVLTLNASGNLVFQASYTGNGGVPTTGNQARGATSLDNVTWFVADKGGIYTTTAATPATTEDSTTNMLITKSFGGQVYGFSATAPGVTTVTPSGPSIGTLNSSLTNLPATATGDSDFYLISSGVNGATFDILYVCAESSATAGTIYKYSLVNGGWVANSSYSTNFGGRSMVAIGNGTGATLYLTGGDGGTSGTSVVEVVNTAGWDSNITVNTANNVNLYTFASGSTGPVDKGIAFAPLATALPDLTIAASGPSSANSTFAYTVTLANSGAASASGVNAQFTLPSGLTYVSGTDNGSGGFTVSNTNGVVSMTGGTLAAGASETITVQVAGTGGATYSVDAGTTASIAGDGFAVINTSATTTTPIAESNASNNCDNVASTTTIAPPVISVTGTPSAVSTSYGIASVPTSFSASGANLEGNITVTAPGGFEISTSSGSGYAGSLTLVESNGSIPATTIYVRLAASTTDGTYSGNVSLSTAGLATAVNEPIPSSTVNPSANLSGLTLSTGGLTQQFSATVTSYTQYVASSATSVTLTPTADTSSTVTINGQSASTPVSLNTGSNTITIVVTNGDLTQTYTVTVVRAGVFTPGDLVVSTYGNIAVAPFHPDGQTTLITLEEFPPAITANSTPVMAFALPSAVAGNNAGITGEYGSSSEGTIEQTADGLYLTLGGYSAVPAFAYTATALAQSPCATVPRVAALIDGNTNCDTSSVFNDIYNTNNPRCVYSPDDLNLYLSGQGAGTGDEGGIYYTQDGTNTTSGGTAPTGIFNVVSTRTLVAYGGNLYYSADQNSSKGIQTGVFEYTGLPTASQGSNTGTLITPANNGSGVNYSPDGLFFANATTLYVADTGDPKADGTGDGGIQKWVYNGSQWVLEYTLTNPNFVSPASATTAAHGETGFEAIAGTVSNGVAYLYAVSYTAGDGDPNGLYGITDTVAATSSTASFTEIAAAPGIQASGTNPDFVYKGVSFAPTGSPVNSMPASNITAAGATLNGSINPEGTDTTAYFEYGTTTAYGTTTSSQDLGSGDSAVPFSIPLGGLQANTTYYYELVTVANGLTSTYAGQTFTTAAGSQTTTDAVGTPTMPPAALVILALALMGVSAGLLKRNGRGAAI